MRLIDADALISELLRGINADTDRSVQTEFTKSLCMLLCKAIEIQPTIDAEPHWIPCSERLPEDDRSKVVTLANGITEVGYYSNGDWWCIGDTVTLENPTVIAWMPLPEPYRGEE